MVASVCVRPRRCASRLSVRDAIAASAKMVIVFSGQSPASNFCRQVLRPVLFLTRVSETCASTRVLEKSVYPPPCLQAREACPVHPSCFSALLRSGAVSSSVLKTQQVQPLIRRVTRFRTFLHFFSETLFSQRSVPKRLPRDPPKHPKISKICKKSNL